MPIPTVDQYHPPSPPTALRMMAEQARRDATFARERMDENRRTAEHAARAAEDARRLADEYEAAAIAYENAADWLEDPEGETPAFRTLPLIVCRKRKAHTSHAWAQTDERDAWCPGTDSGESNGVKWEREGGIVRLAGRPNAPA